MKRSTWIAVLVTTAVLAVAGNLSRLSADGITSAWRDTLAHATGAWPRLARRTPHAPALASRAPARASRARTGAAAPMRRLPAPPSLLVSPLHRAAFPALPVLPVPGVSLLGGGAVALLLALAGAWAWRTRSDRRGLVFQLAHRGLPATRIASRAHVPQDAVRTLLTPGMGARRARAPRVRTRAGRNFRRPATPAAAGARSALKSAR